MFAAKDDIFCMFEGVLENLGSLRHQYGLSKTANEVVLVIEAYKALRDRAPYPASFMLSHLTGSYAFVLFDKSTNSLLVASVSAVYIHVSQELSHQF
jgi:asparagine synthetase B (glutamine-hydrolysing)